MTPAFVRVLQRRALADHMAVLDAILERLRSGEDPRADRRSREQRGPEDQDGKTGESPALGQLIAFLTRALICASSAAVSSFSANSTGHMAPLSRFAVSLKPSVAYLVLNFSAGLK